MRALTRPDPQQLHCCALPSPRKSHIASASVEQARGQSVPLPALSFDGAADTAPTLDDRVLQVVIDRALELRGGLVYGYAGLGGAAGLSE